MTDDNEQRHRFDWRADLAFLPEQDPPLAGAQRLPPEHPGDAPRYAGVIWEDSVVVWSCGHAHQMFLGTADAAAVCALAERRRRQAARM